MRDRAARVEREAGQQRAQAAAADGDRAPVELHFQRPEHADDHEGTVAGHDEFARGPSLAAAVTLTRLLLGAGPTR